MSVIRDLKRRDFLKAMKLGLLALPVLGETVSAAGTAPKRMVVITATGGVAQNDFWPTDAGGAALDLTKRVFPAVSAPLKKHAASLNFVKGLYQRNFTDDFPQQMCGANQCAHGGAHDALACLLSAKLPRRKFVGEPRGFMESHPTGPTLDQYVGRKIAAGGGPNPVSMGVVMNKQGGRDVQRRCFYSGLDQPVEVQDDTVKLFDTYFANKTESPAAARLRAENASVLDAVYGDLQRFSVRAGQEYKYKVDSHLTAVRDLEKLLSTPASGSTCSRPAVPAFNASDLSQYDKAMEAQLRFIAAALACDAVRTVGLQTSNAENYDLVFGWLGFSGPGQVYSKRSYHDVQHKPGTNDVDKIKIDTWYMEQLSFLLDQMSAVKEGSGTLLDNSLVLWTNHSHTGGDHAQNTLPWVVAGKCGGALKTGQFLTVNDESTSIVLTAACKAMGFPADSTFADDRYNKPMAALLA